jgi:transcriptional regulator with XRE-family HTH domain
MRSIEEEKEAAQRFTAMTGAAIKAAAAFDGKSIKQLSRETGVEYVTLGRYLNGKRDIPLSVVYRCCNHLSITMPGLFTDVYARMGWIKTEFHPHP